MLIYTVYSKLAADNAKHNQNEIQLFKTYIYLVIFVKMFLHFTLLYQSRVIPNRILKGKLCVRYGRVIWSQRWLKSNLWMGISAHQGKSHYQFSGRPKGRMHFEAFDSSYLIDRCFYFILNLKHVHIFSTFLYLCRIDGWHFLLVIGCCSNCHPFDFVFQSLASGSQKSKRNVIGTVKDFFFNDMVRSRKIICKLHTYLMFPVRVRVSWGNLSYVIILNSTSTWQILSKY